MIRLDDHHEDYDPTDDARCYDCQALPGGCKCDEHAASDELRIRAAQKLADERLNKIIALESDLIRDRGILTAAREELAGYRAALADEQQRHRATEHERDGLRDEVNELAFMLKRRNGATGSPAVFMKPLETVEPVKRIEAATDADVCGGCDEVMS